MANLTRWDPFPEMISMRNTMDQLLESMSPWQKDGGPMSLALDVSENDNEYTVQAAVPGMKPEDLDIRISDSTLTISGETKQEAEREGERHHLRERRYGRFQRSINLPTPIDSDKVDARVEDGLLKLRLPKSEKAQPKRISVRS